MELRDKVIVITGAGGSFSAGGDIKTMPERLALDPAARKAQLLADAQVIRALRDGWGIDLQLAVNRDMQADFAAYPGLWGLTSTDRNIDHRRVPNLRTLFAHIGAEVPLEEGPTPYLPGDIVTWTLPGNLDHIGIVSDRLTADGTPLVLHNIGRGAQEEDILFAYPMTGHYRIGKDQARRLKALAD